MKAAQTLLPRDADSIAVIGVVRVFQGSAIACFEREALRSAPATAADVAPHRNTSLTTPPSVDRSRCPTNDNRGRF